MAFAWASVIGWAALAAVGPFVGLLVGMIVLGSVPAVPLGTFLGRARAVTALVVAAAAGTGVLPLTGAAVGGQSWGAPWLWSLALAGLILYTFPLVTAGWAAAWLASREQD
ncbi:hypothetical protein GCM10020229_62670 [Kitasatospora albolonga]|uniref:hypothetical protein n=1 Tax=Kitasatospora albolonga TaxID=68173 RepID=UPI0031EDD883